MLSSHDIDRYLKALTPEQADSVRSVRKLIFEYSPSLVEQVDEGKWFNGLLTYSTRDGLFVYALGPRSGGFTTFHMMPYYGSMPLQERNGAALKPFLTGKSCIKFKRFEDLPEPAIRDILGTTKKFQAVAKEMMEKRKKT